MENTDLLLRFLCHASIGDRENAESLLSANFKVREVESLPYGGVYERGRGWWRINAIVNSYWQFNEIRLQEAIESSDGDTVCLIVHLLGRCRSNGREIDTRVCEIWRFKDGLIESVDPFFWDTALMVSLINDTDSALASPIKGGGFENTLFTIDPQLAERWQAAKQNAESNARDC